METAYGGTSPRTHILIAGFSSSPATSKVFSYSVPSGLWGWYVGTQWSPRWWKFTSMVV
ncbi:MAG: hypothetical protein GWN18_08240 [Thermoplasmata archaeon]|nr:hypothetical protein [Thermoplasmata archaeon]NIS12027.1 hypothetical protein [Thermoplasmata archaeon]NIS19955.1 hypothetical protein [Thermoplasmata archaeon]NIT77143.1 hypothetical protein [Thermoplasmata archaeon]NIU49065.1 hypothetical protein [Thermoplasmata archaeon]